MFDIYGDNYEQQYLDNNKICYYYNGELDVCVNNGKICSISNNGKKVKTKRGIHSGSTFKDMQEAYGHNYKHLDYGGSTSRYVYQFLSKEQNIGYICFDIRKKDNIVQFISVFLKEYKEYD